MLKFISKLALSLFSVALMLPGAGEVSANANTKTRNFARPTSVPADYVPTPLGLYVSSKCVLTLPAAEAVLVTKTGMGPSSGPLASIPHCSLPRYNRDGSEYQQGANLMDESSGNHDVIISYDAPVPANLSSQLGGAPRIAIPTNISGQTIYLTAALTKREKGWFQFLAFNMPGFKNVWIAGTAIADIQGNVIIQTATPGHDGSDFTSFIIANDLIKNSTGSVYRGAVNYSGTKTAWMNYQENTMLSDSVLFSMQTFGVTSCDMLPPSGKISGNAVILNSDSNPLTINPTTWSSGLCNLKATTGNPGSNNFSVTFDTNQKPQGRSATITYITK